MKTLKAILSISGIERFIRSFLVFLALVMMFHKSGIAQPAWNHQYFNSFDCIGVEFPSSDTGFIFQREGNLFKTIDKGETWNIIDPPGAQHMGPGKFTTSQLGILLATPFFLTTNGGHNWNSMSNILPAIGGTVVQGQQFVNSISGYISGLDFYPDPFPCCYDGVIYKTTNSGGNWNLVYRAGGDIYQELYFRNENEGVILSSVYLISTSDGGHNWIRNHSFFGQIRFFYASSMTDPFKDTIFLAGYMAGDTATVIRSTDGGGTWQKSLQLPYLSRLRKICFLDNMFGYAVGDTGLIVKTTNGGVNWTVLNSGTRKRLNGVSFINKDTGIVVGDSGLVLTTYTGGILTGVGNEAALFPDRFLLHQNYPNPFNPVTNIRYDLPEDNFVTIKVFDVLGREALTLVDEHKQAGRYLVSLNGANLSSGIYFYTIKAGEFSKTRRMTLLK